MVELKINHALKNESFLAREWNVLVDEFGWAHLSFRNLRVSQPVSAMLLFKAFKTYSLVYFKSSLPQFDRIPLRNFGLGRLEYMKIVVMRLYSFHYLYLVI